MSCLCNKFNLQFKGAFMVKCKIPSDEFETAWEHPMIGGRHLANICCYDTAKKFNAKTKKDQQDAEFQRLKILHEKDL